MLEIDLSLFWYFSRYPTRGQQEFSEGPNNVAVFQMVC